MDKIIFSPYMSVESAQRILAHYGMPRRSGRYPWGSGENPYQHTDGFRSRVAKLTEEFLKDYPYPDKLKSEKGMRAAIQRAHQTIADGYGMSLAEFRYYTYQDLKQAGKTANEIAAEMGMSSGQLRDWITVNKAQQTMLDVAEANRLKEKGYSNVAIAEKMGYSDGKIRQLLQPAADARAKETTDIINALKERIDEVGYIDVGSDVNLFMGISQTRMDAVVFALKEEGYNLYYQQVKQLGTGKDTNLKVLTKEDWQTFRDAYAEDPSIIKSVGLYRDSIDDEIRQIQPPVDISSKRVFIRYAEDGGVDKDGTIELRPGVEDLNLGENRFVQSRVSVDGKYYMKGMAYYTDEIPDGYDIVYNTNKKRGTPADQVFKEQKDDAENPFGAVTHQLTYIGKDGKEHISAINAVNEEATWDDWSRTLASQFLSKQSPDLAKRQLKIVSDSKQEEFDSIMELNNPTVKSKMLQEFADSCDSAAEHLKAAALPRQKTKAIIPIPSLKDNEVYAPDFRDGETVVLIRYPHAGTFEIPELTVNNKNAEAKKILGQAIAQVGINKNVADRLSGADFDGDSVIVIPNNDKKIKTSDPLPQLKDFDNKAEYGIPHAKEIQKEFKAGASIEELAKKYDVSTINIKDITKDEKKRESIKNLEMGKVSNLITDMTIKGAPLDEIARAVKHSMVVIDSVKHNLDYKQSYRDNGIQELADIYQAKEGKKKGGGASTIVSRSEGERQVNERKELTSTRGMTPEEKAAWDRGEKVYRETGRTYVKSKQITDPSKMTDAELERYNSGKKVYRDTGKVVTATTKTTGMGSVKDARELSSGTVIETVYADHANTLKSLANQARAVMRSLPRLKQSPSAAKTYAEEVESLKTKLRNSQMNAPKERQAQLIATSRVQAQVKANPGMSGDAKKKAESKALQDVRNRIGSNKKGVRIEITPREWEAIQAGAISDSTLRSILNNTDMTKVKQYATPRTTKTVSNAILERIKGMYARGLTQAEIADQLGISTSTVSNAIRG